MKVILTETIEKVGVKGDVVNVKRGFARNFLIPRKYAIIATPQNMKSLDGLKKHFQEQEAKQMELLKQLAALVSETNLIFFRKVDEHENMYGSVSENDILHALKEKNIDIPKPAVIMDKHIRQLGEFSIPIRLHKDVLATLHGVVEKESD